MRTIGIDAHKRNHTLVAIDSGGQKLGQKTVASNSSGHADAIRWATKHFGTDLMWAVEDNRSVTGLLERELLAAGPWPVVRCPPHLMARNRASAREWGKSDPIDALAVARVALREPNLPVAFHDPVSWELKVLVNRRECASPAFPETSGPGLILQAWRKEVCSGSDEEVSGRAA